MIGTAEQGGNTLGRARYDSPGAPRSASPLEEALSANERALNGLDAAIEALEGRLSPLLASPANAAGDRGGLAVASPSALVSALNEHAAKVGGRAARTHSLLDRLTL